jgi:hypothetical protein
MRLGRHSQQQPKHPREPKSQSHRRPARPRKPRRILKTAPPGSERHRVLLPTNTRLFLRCGDRAGVWAQ